MGRPAMSPDTIRENKVKIINAAIQMIRENGTQSVSARSIGNQIDMNSALIYRYFKDINEVILFACVNVLQEYNEDMSASFSKYEDQMSGSAANELSDEEIYYISWDIFCKHAFNHPEEYNILFFSKHSNRLPAVIREYYELFPRIRKEKDDYIIEGMYRTSNLRSRNLLLLIPVLSSRYSEKEIILINDLTVSFFYGLITELIGDSQVSPETQTDKMLQACRFLINK